MCSNLDIICLNIGLLACISFQHSSINLQAGVYQGFFLCIITENIGKSLKKNKKKVSFKAGLIIIHIWVSLSLLSGRSVPCEELLQHPVSENLEASTVPMWKAGSINLTFLWVVASALMLCWCLGFFCKKLAGICVCYIKLIRI